jgi:hypothetical protein
MGTDVPDRAPHYLDLVLQTGKRPNRSVISGSAKVHRGVTRGSNSRNKNTVDAVPLESLCAIKERVVEGN